MGEITSRAKGATKNGSSYEISQTTVTALKDAIITLLRMNPHGRMQPF